jgi:hypothetical protein
VRFPMPDAAWTLQQLTDMRLILVTNRDAANRRRLEAWLAQHGLLPYLSAVHLNDTGEPGPLFKRNRLRELHVDEYVEDNPEIAVLLARAGIQVYLRKWSFVPHPREPRVRGYDTGRELVDLIKSRVDGTV